MLNPNTNPDCSPSKTNLTLLALALIFGLLLPVTAMAGDQRQKHWVGGADKNNWNHADNWDPKGKPTRRDDVIIPADAGKIRLPQTTVKVNSLTIKPASKTGATRLTGFNSKDPINIQALKGDVCVGKNVVIKPGAAANGEDGGKTTIQALQGTVKNRGIIAGGNGGTGNQARAGGMVNVAAGVVDNDCGIIEGGDGGELTANGASNCFQSGARKGGDSKVHGTKKVIMGTVRGGKGGQLRKGVIGKPGDTGKPSVTGTKIEKGKPAEEVQGKEISLRGESGIDLRFAASDTMIATNGAIYVDAQGRDIDLRGIAAGTLVFDCRNLCLEGNVLVDPGVNVNSLCTGNVHFGTCARVDQKFFLSTETFVATTAVVPPVDWTSIPIVGTDWNFEIPLHIPVPAWAADGKAAIIDAGTNGANPDQAELDTKPFSVADADGPILLEWDQWHQPSTGSNVEVFVVPDNGPAVPVFFDNTGTSQNDHPVIDITSALNNANECYVKFQYTGLDSSFWIVDNVAVKEKGESLGGQAPVPFFSVLDINGCRNAYGYSVDSGEDGPYFADAETNQPLDIYFQGTPNQPVFFLSGFVVPQSSIDPLFGILDLSNYQLLDSGLGNTPFSLFFNTDQFGDAAVALPMPPNVAGLSMGFQAVIADPSGQFHVTNAVEVQFAR